MPASRTIWRDSYSKNLIVRRTLSGRHSSAPVRAPAPLQRGSSGRGHRPSDHKPRRERCSRATFSGRRRGGARARRAGGRSDLPGRRQAEGDRRGRRHLQDVRRPARATGRCISFERGRDVALLRGARAPRSSSGCIDRRRDRSCKGDPSGTLSFTFRYWALFGSDGSRIAHLGRPAGIRSSLGRARSPAQPGVLTFVDSPTPKRPQDGLHRQSHARGRQGVARAASRRAPPRCEPGC